MKTTKGTIRISKKNDVCSYESEGLKPVQALTLMTTSICRIAVPCMPDDVETLKYDFLDAMSVAFDNRIETLKEEKNEKTS